VSRLSIWAILVAAITAFGGSSAQACSCLGLGQSEKSVVGFLERSGFVLLGKVQSIDHDADRNEEAIHPNNKVNLVVVEAYKGTEDGDLLTVIDNSGMCGRPLEEGNTYLIFASVIMNDKVPRLFGCGHFLYESTDGGVANEHQLQSAKYALDVLRRLY